MDKTKEKKIETKKKPKKQKGRIRLVALLITAVLIAAIGISVTLFKNMAVKSVLKNGLESAFGAKCDIGAVDLGIFDSKLGVYNLAVADKNAPLKNLFAFERAIVDFDLTQLLKGRFVADELTIAGLTAGTERKTSGALPAKKQKAAKPREPSAFEIQAKEMLAQASVRANTGVQQVLEQYNPQNLLESYTARLKTPASAQTAEKQLTELASYWQGAAQKLTDSGKAVYEAADALAQLQNSTGSDLEKIRSALSSLDSLLKNAQTFQVEAEKAVTHLKDDAQNAADLGREVQGAVQADMNLVNSEIAKFSSFSFKDGERLLTGALDTVALNVLEKYYPLVKKGLAMLAENKKESASQKSKPKKKAVSRLPGRTLQFTRDMPSLVIKKTLLSGSDAGLGFAVSGEARNISSDADKLGQPTAVDLRLENNTLTANLDVLIDLRRKPAGEPVQAALAVTGFPVALRIPLPQDVPGLPVIDGKAAASANLKCTFDGNFALETRFAVNPARITAASFEPAFVYDLYAKSLAAITSFSVDAAAAYETANGLRLSLSSDADKQLAAALSAVLNAEMAAVKKRLTEQVRLTLDEYSAPFREKAAEFAAVQKQVEAEKARIDALVAGLQKQAKDWEEKIKTQAADAVKSQVQNAASNALKKFF